MTVVLLDITNFFTHNEKEIKQLENMGFIISYTSNTIIIDENLTLYTMYRFNIVEIYIKDSQAFIILEFLDSYYEIPITAPNKHVKSAYRKKLKNKIIRGIAQS